MGDLKPLGSEKLQGIDKLKRIMEIARYNEKTQSVNEGSVSKNSYSIQLPDGYTYGIVLEKSGYIIKKGINESTLDYNEPIRQRKYYRSYSEAMKKLNLVASELNRLHENHEGISLLGEQPEAKKKFVLKTNKPKTPSADAGTPPAPEVGAPPAPEAGAPPAPDAGTPPAPDAGTPPAPEDDLTGGGEEGMSPSPEDDLTGGGEEGMPPAPEGEEGMEMTSEPEEDGMTPPEEGDEESGGESKVSLKAIQKLTGRLSQKVREYEKEKGMDSQDKKYVLNSLISAINVKSLDDDDRDDIFDKLEQYDEYDMGDEGDLDVEGSDMEGMEEEPTAGDELTGGDETTTEPESTAGDELTGGSAEPPLEESVESVLMNYFNVKPNERPLLEQKKKKDFIKNTIKKVNIKNEIKNLSESKSQYLKSLQLLENFEDAKFVGKSNLENLIFSINGKKYKVTPRGKVI